MLAQTVGKMVNTLINSDARKATKYLSERETIKVARQFPRKGRNTRTTFIVTFGTPNYLERQFIRQCKKAGEPFPVKRVQLKYYPKRKQH